MPPDPAPLPLGQQPTVEEIQPQVLPSGDGEDAVLVPGGPLGLGEAEAILGEAGRFLSPDSGTTPSLKEVERAAFAIEQVALYAEQISRIMAGSVPYRWVRLAKKRVETEGLDHRTMPLDRPVGGVGAVRLTPLRGEMHVVEVTLEDSRGNRRVFHCNRLLDADTPRHEVLYLPRPVEAVACEILMRREGEERTPIILIELGLPERPEYAREIASFCRDALMALRGNDRARALDLLALARLRLKDFHMALATPDR
ncbi:hypothetical protein HQ520_09745 [bacterium]|nr:hypothetical protein [bacterium]